GDLIQRGQLFAGPGQPGGDGRRFAAGAGYQFVVIEGVQRLADLEGDVVGHINDIVDRALADQLQPALHPPRRWLHRRIAQQRQREPLIVFRVFDPDECLSLDGRAFHDDAVRRIAHLFAEQRGDFARDADDAEAAGQIGRQVDVEDDIAEDVSERRTRHIRLVVFQNEDTLMFVRNAEFFFRADHAAIGDAAQRPFLQNHAFGFVAVAVPYFRAFFGERRPQ